jgi:hypothetical protein
VHLPSESSWLVPGTSVEHKESIRWLRGVERAGELLTNAASVVVVGDRENDIYSCFARRPKGVDLIVRAAQDRALVEDASLFASAPRGLN